MIELRWLELNNRSIGVRHIGATWIQSAGQNVVLQYRSHTESWEEVLENGVRGYKPKKVTTEWKDVPTVRED